MKNLLTAAFFAAMFFANTSETLASGNDGKSYHFRSLVPRKGYWVIQQAPEKPSQAVIYFYNENHELVKKEIRDKKDADISRKRVLRSLKRSLEEAIDWSEPIY